MKKIMLYASMAFMVCLSPAQAYTVPEEEPSFWSNIFNAVINAFTPIKLTPDNCDICHSNGMLYVNYYEESSHSSYSASKIYSSSGGVYYTGYHSKTPEGTPFGTLTLTSSDSVYVDYDGFSTCLVLDRMGETTKIKAVYADGDKVYVDVKESFGAYDARDYVYLNTEMLSWDQGCFYVDLQHKGVLYRFSPASIEIDGDLMYVSAIDNNLYFNTFGEFELGSIVATTNLPTYSWLAQDHELVFLGNSLAIYQHGEYSYPNTVYATGSNFLFD